MFKHVIAILALGLLCGGWVLLQRWLARKEPEIPGLQRKCGACGERCSPGPADGRGARTANEPCAPDP